VDSTIPPGLTSAARPGRQPSPVADRMPADSLPGADDTRLRAAAIDLEAAFLSEMLRAAGFGKPLESFGGGAGEEQFASLLVGEHARAIAATGGLGLSEHIYRALVERENATA